MNKLIFIVPLFLLVLTMPAYAITINATDIADAYVKSNAPTGNFNGDDLYALKSTYNFTIYMLFNISQIPSGSTINSARIMLLNKSSAGAYGFLYFTVYNSSNTWNETGITYNNAPAVSVLQSNTTLTNVTDFRTWKYLNISDVAGIQSALDTGKSNVSLVIRMVNSGSGFFFYSKDSANDPVLEIDFTTSNDCNTTIIGSYCDQSDISGRGIITTPDYTCENDSYYTCPEGMRCTQITPQVNVTTALIEDFTDCSQCFYVYSTVLGFYPALMRTNCPDNPECISDLTNVSNLYFSSCVSDPLNPRVFSCPSVFITPADTVPASFEVNTAGCWDTTLQRLYTLINETGGQSTIEDFTVRVFGAGTNATTPRITACPNSTTSCYVLANGTCEPALCVPSTGAATTLCSAASGYTDQLVCAMGGMLGVSDIGNSKFIASILFSFIIAIAVLAALNYYGVGGESMGMVFMMSLLMLTIMFTFIGWFPSWIMIILMVLGALMVAKMLKVV